MTKRTMLPLIHNVEEYSFKKPQYYLFGDYPKSAALGIVYVDGREREDLHLLDVYPTLEDGVKAYKIFDKRGYQGLMMVEVNREWR